MSLAGCGSQAVTRGIASVHHMAELTGVALNCIDNASAVVMHSIGD